MQQFMCEVMITVWSLFLGQNIYGLSDVVAETFKDNRTTGCETLALNMEGRKMVCIEQAGTLCLILEEIKLLKQASSDIVTLIKRSPYYFCKILYHLCLKLFYTNTLMKNHTYQQFVLCSRVGLRRW